MPDAGEILVVLECAPIGALDTDVASFVEVACCI